MDFVCLIIFLALYYLRPQEWFSEFNALHPVQLLSVLAMWAMFQKQRLNPRDLIRTPLDWMMLAYFLWTLVAGDQFLTTLGGIEAVLLFYFVAVQSLDSVRRIKVFLGWWCAFMLIVAALAIASLYGFDPLNSFDKTEGIMKGRLILNLSVFNNPNTLAHSIVPCVPLVYYLLFWRRAFVRAGLILLAIPLYCIYLTESKGAFLCGFAVLLCTLIFGRSRIWQVFILVIAIGFGYGALYKLPRMHELQNSKTDPAIQGRVAALKYGLQLMRTNYIGIGLGNFEEYFFKSGPLEKDQIKVVLPSRTVRSGGNGTPHQVPGGTKRVFVYSHYVKATHCAYNQNGAELGYVGLYLFVGLLYCCLRTLLLVKSKDNEEERLRRALFVTVVAYAVSSWMVDFCYRPTFFMMVAAISAFHRHLLRKQEVVISVVDEPAIPGRPWLRRLPPIKMPGIPLPGLSAPLPAGSAASLAAEIPAPALASTTVAPIPVLIGIPTASMRAERVLPWHKPALSLEDKIRKKFIWTRLGIMDFIIILILTYAAIRYWEHLIATM